MIYSQVKQQFILFFKLFIILFIILFVLPNVLDAIFKIFLTYEPPRGNSILVSKNLYDNMSFIQKYLTIVKNIIFSL